jgi:hypothetical protein
MTQPAAAYRNINPANVDAFHAWQDRKLAFGAAIRAVCEDMFPGSRPAVRDASGCQRFVGVVWDEGPVPDGWRLLPGRGVPTIVPKKNTRVGKERAARFQLECADPVVDGMPRELWLPSAVGYGFTVYHPGLHLFDDVLWATWSIEIPTSTPGHDDDGTDAMGHSLAVDESMWVRERLSAWHVANEAREEQPVASGGCPAGLWVGRVLSHPLRTLR